MGRTGEGEDMRRACLVISREHLLEIFRSHGLEVDEIRTLHHEFARDVVQLLVSGAKYKNVGNFERGDELVLKFVNGNLEIVMYIGCVCPNKCGEATQLLSTTNEWKYFCLKCQIRFNEKGEILK
jgi:hypothetical protein